MINDYEMEVNGCSSTVLVVVLVAVGLLRLLLCCSLESSGVCISHGLQLGLFGPREHVKV